MSFQCLLSKNSFTEKFFVILVSMLLTIFSSKVAFTTPVNASTSYSYCDKKCIKDACYYFPPVDYVYEENLEKGKEKGNWVVEEIFKEDEYCKDISILKSVGCDVLKKDCSNDGFFASVFYNKKTKDYVLAFRGTQVSPILDCLANKDCLANIKNAILGAEICENTQYKKAERIALDMQLKYKKKNRKDIVLVGHSLGGGLAAYAALKHGLEAHVYNTARNTFLTKTILPYNNQRTSIYSYILTSKKNNSPDFVSSLFKSTKYTKNFFIPVELQREPPQIDKKSLLGKLNSFLPLSKFKELAKKPFEPIVRGIMLHGRDSIKTALAQNGCKKQGGYLEYCANKNTQLNRDIATAIVLDHSGSMKEERKIEYAREAAVAFYSNMADQDHISISVFSDVATTPAELEMQSKKRLGAKLISILVNISPSGKTNIGAGLTKGLDQLCSVDSQKLNKGALLLSDGINNVGEYQSIVEKYKKLNIPISTIRFGQKASEQNLKQIAQDTGGVYWPADQSNVASVYARQIDAINGNSTILSAHDLMGPADTNDYQFTVTPGAENLNINTSWQGSRLKTVLIPPSGSRYYENQLLSSNDRFEEGRISQFTQILNPEPGEWAINMSWDIAPKQAERVNLSISEHLDVYTNILGFAPQYTPGHRVSINVQAAELSAGNKKIPLTSTHVYAQVQIPAPDVISEIQSQSINFRVYKEIVQDNTKEIELFDDGKHDDYAAGDGIFGGYFQETEEKGTYIVTAQIEGSKADGKNVTRKTVSSFQVGPLLSNKVTTSQIVQHANRLNEQLKAKVVNPLGKMQGSSSNTTPLSSPKPKKKKRSRSLMDSLSN